MSSVCSNISIDHVTSPIITMTQGQRPAVSRLVSSRLKLISRHGLRGIDSSHLEATNSYEQGPGPQGGYTCRSRDVSVKLSRSWSEFLRECSPEQQHQYHLVVLQSLSHVWLFVTPRTAAHQAFLSFTISWSLLKLMSNESVMPFKYLILIHLLILWLQSPSTVILELKKIKSVTLSTFPPFIFHEVMGPDTKILVFLMLSF